ncbi:DUF6531 domain-containing protein [Variovorax humicola]|uniref:DUF6531 domain-containing protein n=1 Tax=Variovorax humicola TaxID=1769758 RepID=A0ABU8WBM3_9BURK
MLASSWGDPVLGIDIHWEFVPMPAPVPTPIPNPFTGVVFDPMGLAVGLAISNAIGMALGGSLKGPVTYWGMPATNTGTEAKHVPGHIIIPPGTSWAPVPKTPKPAIRGAPKPEKPVTPSNDAVVITGSKTVHVMGTNASRLGDLLLSCSEPVRLPSSVILAVPKGAPILIGGPPHLDLMAAAMASLRTRFIGDSIQAGISHLPIGNRGRAVLSWLACKLTGHPVDVATGKVMTRFLDAELPGPMPLRIERFYSSNFAGRSSPHGHGWSTSVDRAVWEERGKVVCLLDDGREIEFDTFDLPQHTMQVGDEIFYPIDRLTLRREENERWRITDSDGFIYEYAPVAGRSGRAPIARILSRGGLHEITFSYDAKGRLEWVRDSADRFIGFEHDEQDRLVVLKLPHPDQRGWYAHRSYEYDAEGDLVRVFDSQENAWSFEYVTHLLVKETQRGGLSFYFEYDGLGGDAWCTRTWGDGGIYDHVINYDKKNKVTFVADSLGHKTQYHLDANNLVTKIVDPLGNAKTFKYHPRFFTVIESVDALGAVTRSEFDAQGNKIAVETPDNARVLARYDEGLPIEIRDQIGGVWRYSYDSGGQLLELVAPTGETVRFGYDAGIPVWLERADGTRATFEWDGAKNLRRTHAANGAVTEYQHDALGQLRKFADARGRVIRFQHDLEGRLVLAESSPWSIEETKYDADGNVIEFKDGIRTVRYRYTGFRKIAEYRENDAGVEFKYDTEQKLLAVENEIGAQWTCDYDPRGRLVKETDFDGHTRVLSRDARGRIVRIDRSGGTSVEFGYDKGGRIADYAYGDGTYEKVEYRADGAMVRAESPWVVLEIEPDALRRVRRESTEESWVASEIAPGGNRGAIETSLGARLGAAYDALGLPSVILLGGNGGQQLSLRIERDPLGEEMSVSASNGVSAVWTRDGLGRPASQRVIGSDREVVGARAYRWKSVLQLDAILDAQAGLRTFEHDERGRLKAVHTPHGTDVRAYDKAGRVHRDQRRTYSPGGRLLEDGDTVYEYDGEGRRVARRCGSEEWRYLWTDGGLLRQVVHPDNTVTRFEYDALKRRTKKAHLRVGEDGGETILRERRFVWDRHVVAHEIDSIDGVTTWYWEPESFRPIARERGGERWMIVTDDRGVPSEMFDAGGTLAWRAQIDVYGKAHLSVGERGDCPWRFPGQYDDAELGLYYNYWRYFDPQSDSYISPDPLGLLAGLRAWGYVLDPMLRADPFGLVDEYAVQPYGNAGHTGDGLDADEMLGSVWLRENGYGKRSGYVGRRNPAMGIDPALHREITAAQREAGLFDHATVRGQTAAQNIAENAKVRQSVIADWLVREEGLSRRAANREAKELVDAFKKDAQAYANQLDDLSEEAKAKGCGG